MKKKKKKKKKLWSELERKLGYGEVCKSQGTSTYHNLPCLTNMNLYKPCDIKRQQTAVFNKNANLVHKKRSRTPQKRVSRKS
jgi:hypothetical protein